MTSRAEAMADLAGAISSEVLGQSFVIDGEDVDAVRRSFTVEEALSFSGGGFDGDGLSVAGFRLTVDSAALAHQPVVGGAMTVDGLKYDVRLVVKMGSLLRITLTRYLA